MDDPNRCLFTSNLVVSRMAVAIAVTTSKIELQSIVSDIATESNPIVERSKMRFTRVH